MISHGIAGFLKERMYDSSDGFRVHVCDQVRYVLFYRIELIAGKVWFDGYCQSEEAGVPLFSL